MSALDVNKDGTIDEDEVANFVRFYNTFVQDFILIKRFLYFMCLGTFIAWAVVIAVIIPLNVLANKVESSDTNEIVNNQGVPLSVRQSTSSTLFSCNPDFVLQLEWVYLSSTRKERILTIDLQATYAVIETSSGTHTFSCPNSTKRATTNTKGNTCADVATNPPCALENNTHCCGNGVLEDNEQCDGGAGCSGFCLCTFPSTPIPGSVNCNTCGDGVVNSNEQCDGGFGCNAECQCSLSYPQDPPSTDCLACLTPDNCAVVGECTIGPASLCTQCTDGFLGSGTPSTEQYCVDANECLSNPCDATQGCINLPGRYECFPPF